MLTLRGIWGFYLNHVHQSYHSGSLNVPFIIFFLNMMNYPVFFILISTLTWDTFLTLKGTGGFYLNDVIPNRASKSYRVGGVEW